jgi:PadR family transcriptional regulator, regulatory protein AphA
MARTQLPLSNEYILLGLLARHPMHGYDLHKEIHSLEAVHLIWEVKQSNLYALLEKLESEGLLSSQVVPGASHPSRRQYQLTEPGQLALAQWTSTPVAHARDMRQDFLARLYFACSFGPDHAAQLIYKQMTACQEWQSSLEAQLQAQSGRGGYEKIIITFRLQQVLATKSWLEECEKEFAHA